MRIWYDKNYERLEKIKKMGKFKDENESDIHDVLICRMEELNELRDMYNQIVELQKKQDTIEKFKMDLV